MKRFALASILALAACNADETLRPPSNLNAEGKFLHPIRLTPSGCAGGKTNLVVDWAIYEAPSNDWTATFKKASVIVAEVRDFRSTKSSGCVYASGDNATVVITPNGKLAERQAVDSASVVIR